MSSTLPRGSTSSNTSASVYRVNYSDYVADITGSPKASRKSATTGIGHHINPLHNPYPKRQNPPVEQPVVMPQYGGSGEKCARCSKIVYIAEKKVGAGRAFHTFCFNCHTCKRLLNPGALSEHKAEIYCKPCYTKQFGAHGLINGVTMSTEKQTPRESHRSHRSSYGGDLDESVIKPHQTIQRSNSNESLLHNRYVASQNNEFTQRYPREDDVVPERTPPTNRHNNRLSAIVDTQYQRSSSPIGFDRVAEPMTFDDRHKNIHRGEQLSSDSGASAMVNIPLVSHPQRSNSNDNLIHRRYIAAQNNEFTQRHSRHNDVLPEQSPPSNRTNNGLSAIVDTRYQRSSSPIGFDKIVEPITYDDRHRSTYYGEDDRSKYIHKGEQLSYGSGSSAVVNIPIVSHPHRSTSTIDRMQTSIEQTRDNQRSRSPSITSNDPYRRANSHERQTDFTDEYIRLTKHEDNNNTFHRTYSNDNTMASGNPITPRNFVHSSSYENTQRNSTSNRNTYEHDQYHSRDSSPAITTNRHRSPSPPTGYTSSAITRTSSNTYQAGTSPPKPYTRPSSSSQHNDRSGFGLNDFISKTNIAANSSPSARYQYSTLSGLVSKPRQQSNDVFED